MLSRSLPGTDRKLVRWRKLAGGNIVSASPCRERETSDLCEVLRVCLNCLYALWVKSETDSELTNTKAHCSKTIADRRESIWQLQWVCVGLKDRKVWLLHFLLRHRKLQESCKEKDRLCSDSDSPEIPVMAFFSGKKKESAVNAKKTF